MGQPSQRTERPATKQSRLGIVNTIIHVVILMLLMSLLAWVFLGVVFGLYQVVHGPAQTQARMNAIISMNIAVIDGTNGLVTNGYSEFKASEKSLLNEVLAPTHLLDVWQWLDRKIQQAPTLQSSLQHIWQKTIQPFLTVFWGVTIIIGTRGFILLLALPVFLLCVGLGLVDGLVQRDVRKFQAARESTYLFHRIKSAWQGCFWIPLFLYWVWPWATSPVWFLMPMAMGLGLMMQISVTSFKKYL